MATTQAYHELKNVLQTHQICNTPLTILIDRLVGEYKNNSSLLKTGNYFFAGDYKRGYGVVYVYKKGPDGVFRFSQSFEGSEYRNEECFGEFIVISDDERTFGVMSKKAASLDGRDVDSPISVYKIGARGEFARTDFVFPKFVEDKSRYGESATFLPDGSVLFVGAPGKENDYTTACRGATGAVYTFRFDEKKKKYIQHQLIRPPSSDILDFGVDLYFEGPNSLAIEDGTGKIHLYSYGEVHPQENSNFTHAWNYIRTCVNEIDESSV